MGDYIFTFHRNQPFILVFHVYYTIRAIADAFGMVIHDSE